MNEVSLSEVSPPERAGVAARPASHPDAASGAVGVLLVNLGTPDATDARSVRRYLREFLADKRVIEEDTIVWKFVLHAIILRRRPRLKGLDYEKIWNREANESPLKTITRSQAAKLEQALARECGPTPGRATRRTPVVVDWAMRYGNPSIRSRIAALASRGCDRILV
jgi:protoporphyrin/coproporphyrin ferrochelatase